MRILLKYILYPAIICLVGFWLKASNNETALSLISKIKLKSFKKLHPRYYANYIGNLLIFTSIPYVIVIAYGFKTLHFYIAVAICLMLALLFHIAQVTGKPLTAVFERLTTTDNNAKNVFASFTKKTAITFLLTGIIMVYLVIPFMDKHIKNNNNNNNITETIIENPEFTPEED